MDPDQMRTMIEAAVTATAAGQAANNAAIVQAAVNAAMQSASVQQQHMRKPNVPPFDPKNIDQWLRRVNAAFDRLNITNPKFKFAHLDEKIPSDKDPVLNDFMSGAPSQENWDAFVTYLKKKHGRTLKQMANSIITGTPREGRCPSQLWSVMKERAGTVTLDDIMKEQFMKQMPPTVREHMQTKLKDKTGKEVAEMADVYFDPDGKLIEQPSTASGINSIGPSKTASSTRPSTSLLKKPNPNYSSNFSAAATAPESTSSFTDAFSDNDLDNGDVNAVRFRQGQKQSFNVQNRNGRSQSRGRQPNRGGATSYNSRRSQSRYSVNNNNSNNNGKCFYHNKYGDNAEKCEPHCSLYSTHSAKGQASR